MTTPDHRPYLTATDLRTPEDVLAWLKERAIAADEGFVSRAATLDEAYAALSARLDRERRQACRRGAHEMTRVIARSKLWLRKDYVSSDGQAVFGSFKECISKMRGGRWGSTLELALAFRAAARTP